MHIYEYLLSRLSDPRNHTLPCEIVKTDTKHPFLIMPYVRTQDTLCTHAELYHSIYQLLEVGLLHIPNQAKMLMVDTLIGS